MFNVGEAIYTVDAMLDKEGKPVKHFVGAHQVAGIHIDQSGTVYEFIRDNQILKVNANQVAGSFDEIIGAIESSNGDMKVCRRCGAIFKTGEGFEIPGLNLCSYCLGVVKEKLSEDNKESEPDKCECSCKNEKCDCEECKCDNEKVVVSDDEAIEEEK
jgi:hypothetical protein